ncbi:dsDNA nuclease domain-containing protein [Streptomyces griseorubiginosus]|uniref:dsDNA nuclease domain-containing protein n=1 Tax=Streptomyces griseorubiginosus TaxID=67304 RepID=UPI00131DF6E8|nr:dsDNA nuclease domain-containing protein [Streptomyces griseorubiginosus]
MSLAPADGGRRSRRGFAYQDVVTLLDCLDMLDGCWTAVSWEDLEDILCHRGDAPVYRQVKTIEEAGVRHSVASVCRPESPKKSVDTSYLGKLFLGKPLPDGTRFTFIVNETPQRDLFEFAVERSQSREPVSAAVRDDAISRLKGLSLPDGRDVAWCIDRLDVLVEARTIEHVEGEVLQRLAPLVRACLGQEPCITEVVDVMTWLIADCISRQARALRPRHFTADEFRAALEECVRKVTGRRQDGSTELLMPLQQKLRPAGVPDTEAEGQHDAMLAFRRRRRSSIGARRQQFDDLADKINSICTVTMAKRRGGLLEAGPAAYLATISAVSEMPEVAGGHVSLTDALAVLCDITARCQNRYADA